MSKPPSEAARLLRARSSVRASAWFLLHRLLRAGRARVGPSARLGVYVTAGLLGILRGGLGYFDPNYYDPVSSVDWAAVLTYSCFYVVLAVALISYADTWPAVPAWSLRTAAAGAFLTGVGNLVEDGARVHWFGIIWALGIALFTVGVFVGGVVLAVSQRGRRADGLLLVASIVSLGLAFSNAGLIVLGVIWLVLASMQWRKYRGRRAWVARAR